MATKSGTKKPKAVFKRIQCYTEEFPGCCGISVICNLREEEGEYDYPNGYWRGARWKAARAKFATKEEQIDDLYKRIVDSIETPCALLSLVSRWNQTEGKNKQEGTMQLPELHDKLLEEGWQINQVFINPVHGDNEVTLFSKVFPEKTGSRDLEDEDWSEDKE